MKRSELFFALVLVPLDFLAMIAAGTAAYYLRFHPYFTSYRPVIFNLSYPEYLKVILPIGIVWLAVFAFAGLYTIKTRSIAVELTRVALACSTSMAVVFAILFFSLEVFESRFIAVAAWIISILFVGAMRLAVRGIQRSLLIFDIGVHRIVVIGQGSAADSIVDTFDTKQRLGFEVVARFNDFNKSVADRIRKMKNRYGLDEIILADPDTSRDTTVELLKFTDIEHLGFRFAADFFSSASGRSIVHTYGGIPVIEVRKTPLDGWGRIYKRAFDIFGSLFLIVITSPIMLIIAIALFIEQPGRILFSRLSNGKKTMRIGEGGRPFHYFKFRSMIKDAHKLRFDPAFVQKHGNLREGTPLFKLKEDPRVTRVGRVLRKYSLDEFPEFFLVLLGRMSLVGPRPHLPEEVKNYEPYQKKVLTLKPGITGMAQISGRADLKFADEVRIDIHYIEHWSPWIDLYILLKTPLVVIFRKGAY